MANMRTLGWVLTGLLCAGVAGCESDDETTGAGGAGGGGASDCPNDLAAEDGACVLAGEYTSNLHLTAGTDYLLKGGVFVRAGAELTIDAGVTIKGDADALSMLVVDRGAKINVNGTADAPVVMTSALPEGMRNRGDWGGLIINGYAPINGCDATPCEASGEGDTGVYGGDEPADSSGTLRYLRVEYAGRLITEGNELNGIAFQGVGSGTTVDYVQVHMNKDDGVEFFGGTVNAKHLVLTGIGDDCLDWTDGWQGKVQHVVALQYEGDGDQGIEADNNGDNNSASPRSAPWLSNVTLVGSGSADSDIGVLLREGTAGHLSNFIVTNFNDACVSFDQDETFAHAWAADAPSGALEFSTSIFHCPTAAATWVDGENAMNPGFTVEAFMLTHMTGNQVADPLLAGANRTDADFRPAEGSPALGGAAVPADAFFDQVDYIGAFGAEDWTAGWTSFAPN